MKLESYLTLVRKVHPQRTNISKHNTIMKKDKDADTKLMSLVIKKYTGFAVFIIKQCVNPNLFAVQNNKGQSVLHVAVYLREKKNWSEA